MSYIKNLLYKFITILILVNIFLLKKFSKSKIIYFKKISFGDTLSYCVENYVKIKNEKIKILVLSKLDQKIIKFFFPNKIIKLFILLPNFISIYRINALLQKSKNFLPTKTFDVDDAKIHSTKKKKKLLNYLIKKNNKFSSEAILKLKKNKYVLMHLKHYNTNCNSVIGSSGRQTANIEKIYSIINLLIKKKIKIIILGNNYDLAYKILNRKYPNKILFFNKLSKSESIIDQLLIHQNSALSLGNPGGGLIISMYLKKRIIFIDSLKMKLNKFPMMYENNSKNIYKKIIFKKKIKIFSDIHVEKILNKRFKGDYKIIETDYKEIKKNIFKFLK